MIKKYGMMLLCAIAVHAMFAMELVEIPSGLSIKEDHKCYWFALYVEKYLDEADHEKQQQAEDFFEQNSLLSQRVQQYQKQMPLINTQVDQFLDTLYDQKIEEAYQSYWQLSFGARYQVAFCFRHNAITWLLNDGQGIVDWDVLQDITQDSCIKSVAEGDSSIQEIDWDGYGQRPVVTKNNNSVLEKWKNCTIRQMLYANFCQGKTLQFTVANHIPQPQLIMVGYDNDKKSCTISFGLEFSIYAYNSRELLYKICEGSTKAANSGNMDECYKLTPEELQELKDLHKVTKHLEEWKAFQFVAIGIDFEKPTWWQRIKDRILLAAPLCLAEIVVPQAMYHGCLSLAAMMPQHVILGRIVCALGIVPSILIDSALVGFKLYPFFDSYNSGVKQLRTTFGKSKIGKVNMGPTFFWYGMFHYIATIIGEYGLGCIGYIGQSVGIATYVARLWCLLYGIFSTKSHNKDYSCVGKFAVNNPLLRGGKSSRVFKLADLVQDDVKVEE